MNGRSPSEEDGRPQEPAEGGGVLANEDGPFKDLKVGFWRCWISPTVEARLPMVSSSSLITGGEGDAWTRAAGGVCGFDVVQDNAGELFEEE